MPHDRDHAAESVTAVAGEGGVAVSYVPAGTRVSARAVLLLTILIVLSWYFWIGWLLWAVVLRFTGARHPDVPLYPSLDAKRRILAVFALLMLVLTLVPTPFVSSDASLRGALEKWKADRLQKQQKRRTVVAGPPVGYF